MLDKSIDGALLALRKQIIRGDGNGLDHVEALLRMRGIAMPAVLPAKCKDAARRGHMRLLLMLALRDGPKTRRDLVRLVATARPELAPKAAYRRTDLALAKMHVAGLVRHEGRVWVWRNLCILLWVNWPVLHFVGSHIR